MTENYVIPRLDGETSRAHAAKVAYVTMGPGRSIDKVADQNRIKTGSRASHYLEWSRKYDWAATARMWDDQQAAAATSAAAEQYQADLAAHRKKAADAGQALYAVAGQLLTVINAVLATPRTIRGEDGTLYTLHNMEFNANTFQIASRAFLVALDLEAHALRVDALLETHDEQYRSE